jgi:signal transduction histidine kinase
VLAGGAAHDFNNLLSGILGNVDLVLEELGDESPLHRRLSEVKRAAQNAAELARQLLAYAGKGRLEMHRFDLGALAEEVAAGILSAGAAGAAARIERRIEPDLPPLEADVTQVRQVLSNLLWNAIEASPATGKVTLSIAMRRVRAADLADAVVDADLLGREAFFIRVSDSGHGMDAATRRRVFEPFFSTKAAGRGLGLAAVLGIVTGHGGTIAIESAAGRGSSFTVLLPLPSPSAGA